jgi:hypothetical protein
MQLFNLWCFPAKDFSPTPSSGFEMIALYCGMGKKGDDILVNLTVCHRPFSSSKTSKNVISME